MNCYLMIIFEITLEIKKIFITQMNGMKTLFLVDLVFQKDAF